MSLLGTAAHQEFSGYEACVHLLMSLKTYSVMGGRGWGGREGGRGWEGGGLGDHGLSVTPAF